MSGRFDKATDEGRAALLRALKEQVIFAGTQEAAGRALDLVSVETLAAKEVLIAEGGDSDDLYFILSGELEVTVDRRFIARRKPREHVGEMAAVDGAARRSATVTAVDASTVARIGAAAFIALANAQPEVWQNAARVLATRLRDRPVRARNERPKVFLGCSVEGLDIAKELQRQLEHAPFEVCRWDGDVFRPSSQAIDDLLRTADACDLAVLVLSPDDKVVSRKKGQQAPRDNVVLELGLFMGVLGARERVLMVRPRDTDMKIPSDLLGLNPITYDPKRSLSDALANPATEVANAVARLGPR